MRDAMRHAGLPGTADAIAALARDPADYLGFVEVHIEQGPVLNALGLPLGVVTSINGGLRYRWRGRRRREPRRHDADGRAARRARGGRRARGRISSSARRRCPTSSARSASLEVPERLDQRRAGPLPLHARHPRDRPTRCATRASHDVLDELKAICERRGLSLARRGDDARGRVPECARLAGALGSARSRRSACRCTACRAAPATTR